MPEQARQLRIVSGPECADKLHLWKLAGGEELGRLFEYTADLLSGDKDVRFDDVVGENLTITLDLPADSSASGGGGAQQVYPPGSPRFFNAYVNSLAIAGHKGRYTHYRATLVPWMWFLTRTANCRIFQNKTVPQIIQDVLHEHGFEGFVEDRLHHQDYHEREYCVQYRETDFDFVSRLMEEEGIYYFFRQENGKHTLILLDSTPMHNAFPGYDQIPYRPRTDSIREREYIHHWYAKREIQPGRFAHTDFDFKKPGTYLLAGSTSEDSGADSKFEVFDYPGGYTELPHGEEYARRRIQEHRAAYEVARGAGDTRGIAVGCRFELTDHDRPDQCKRYLVTGTRIEAVSDVVDSEMAGGEPGGENFTVRFTAIDENTPFRTPRTTPTPMIRGPQTAMVVGPGGEEIHTDPYGRVKVQFHWDRYSEANENSSCWIRVAQVWAGRKWGGMFIPRIGQEVIVEFLEGDPDRPIITGRVYNDRAMPPYELPTHDTMSTLKSLSSKGGGGFNEIRFEDKKGEEQIFVHAEKNEDVRVKNDCFEWIGNNRHLIVKKDQLEHVENKRHEIVDMDHSEEIGRDRNLKVKGKEAKAVDGSLSLTVTGDVAEVFKSNHSEQTTGDCYVKGMNVVIEAVSNITLCVGASHIAIEPGQIEVKSPMLNLTADGINTIKGSLVQIN